MKKKILYILIFLLIIYWLPQLVVIFTSKSDIESDINNLSDFDAVIIFGASITSDNQVTPILKERLEAGKRIWDKNKESFYVLSNTETAVKVMNEYALKIGVPAEKITLDTQAEITTDTCRFEKENNPNGRKLIFVSQGYHLPRLIYQCKKLGVSGIGYPAEELNIIDRSQYSLFTKISVRTKRCFREAGLTWLAVLGIYK